MLLKFRSPVRIPEFPLWKSQWKFCGMHALTGFSVARYGYKVSGTVRLIV